MTTDDEALERARTELAPTGTLRVALNMSNFLLVTGTTPDGEPAGVSPDIARAIAGELGVPLMLLPFDGPGDVADAAEQDVWDLANIAAEAERARTIAFSPAYCEIQATCLLPPGSTLTTFEQIDSPGVRIAVKARSAYDLWLTENLQHASLHRAASIDESFALFVDEGLEVLAGLRPKLLEQQRSLPGATLLERPFTAVQQSIGCRRGLDHGAAWLQGFVERGLDSGLVARAIDKHGVTGRLSVPDRP